MIRSDSCTKSVKGAVEYGVLDFYENPFGEVLFQSTDFTECLAFAEEFDKDTYGECFLRIVYRY